ncbi:acyl-CoA thioesterase [Nocardia jinanensis]|uniref:Acyl-CoA thioesterase II n=1 Tax=Nocardia jinanensis TaxID=382504 RepID=A0A917RQN0_9NOCA|nr:acyl-CoA thioesterase domain-containing protein [Nocardia jinanensis]GGL19611.1 acyl-CoA thioesterase II [Nocardia jinanensis]
MSDRATPEPAEIPESSMARMVAIFDMRADPAVPAHFLGESDGGTRRVVDGSQILGQSIVAAARALPGRAVRTAHALFVSAADPDIPLDFTVTPIRAGRSFASATVTVRQELKIRTSCTVLLDSPQPDLVRRDAPAGLPVAGPGTAGPEASLALPGREVRIIDCADINDPDEVGPPVVDAWLRYDEVPAADELRRAVLAHFTGHLGISTALRPHAGLGTAQAHHTLSTAPMGIGVTFHDPVKWDGWLRYHHEATFVGAGSAHIRGQISTAAGSLIASFTQDAMIRAFDSGPVEEIPSAARL